ncbi:pilus assembly PilX family protein [Pelagibaculum spongiae]|uniref:Type 4 fimbrial biogenesis protein PilX N-terminal domain-containing protein n=1 Tax=Pelagibaculum spongiae TaxID=2080658 RepID=A0A2V1GWP8_9GAMM|nr:hypothetical protein [Pelagibaculum spongiae]PVZ70430.1 hypothetical protein DC094_07515 [Pelagibaculum spongiae]
MKNNNKNQQGYILAIALILLFIMTGLGVTALSNMSLNSRVSNNAETMSECFNSVDGAVSVAQKDAGSVSALFDGFSAALESGIAELYISDKSKLLAKATTEITSEMDNLENIEVYSRLTSKGTSCPRMAGASSIELWSCDYVEVTAINTSSRCSGVGGARVGLVRNVLKQGG